MKEAEIGKVCAAVTALHRGRREELLLLLRPG